MTSLTQPLPPSPLPAGPTVSAGPTAWREVGALRLLTWPALDASGADAAVAARCGGDDPGAVLENRRRLAAGFGVSPADFVFAGQVHAAGVQVVGQADRGRGAFSLDDVIPATDALVTSSPGVTLAILTADCVPIVLHDPVAGVLACVHAGWRGTVARVSAAAVAAMRTLGSRPADVIAGIGPAISAARYQVGPDVYQAVTQAFGPAPFIQPDAVPDRWRLDLWSANRFVLTEAGVPASQIHTTDIPTGPTDPAEPVGPKDPTDSMEPTEPGYFFSDRSARPCGRLALIARLRTGADL
jgi:YfiH family protein